jgi:acyl-CoA thioester hydrolase
MYRKSALLDDELEIATWISNINPSGVMRHYIVKRLKDNEILGQSDSVYMMIDLNTGKPMRFPAGFRRDFEANTSLDKGEVDGS